MVDGLSVLPGSTLDELDDQELDDLQVNALYMSPTGGLKCDVHVSTVFLLASSRHQLQPPPSLTPMYALCRMPYALSPCMYVCITLSYPHVWWHPHVWCHQG